MRTFIAIELPLNIKAALAKLQEELKQSGADVKWVAPQNIHLTLKFLGERDDKKIEKIKRILEEVADGKKPFQAGISSIGAFPKNDSPRVIWVGIGPGDAQIKEVAKELEDKISVIGIPKEDRPFSSHITIARTRSFLNKEKLIQGLGSAQARLSPGKKLEFLVDKIVLFKSTLSPQGPIYETLKIASLKTA